jgi:hypothetical protein
MWGILLMISAVAEGVPYTSIAIRNEFWQDAIGTIGVFLALLGVYLGFQKVVRRETVNGDEQEIQRIRDNAR